MKSIFNKFEIRIKIYSTCMEMLKRGCGEGR